jgi:hypothetical protein
MTPRRLTTILLAPVVGFVLALLVASPAAAVTLQQRLAQLSTFTQPNSSSYNGWNSARQNQSAWAEYAFDWSTDLCSASPDQPLGFDFRLSCHRHDFGYRNYRALGGFDANKPRIDDSFYFDLRAKCATYNVFVRPACNSLAWTYYQAVKNFGALAVTQSQLNKAAELKREGLRQQALATN